MIWNLLADEATTGGSNAGTIIIMIVLVVAIIGLFVWQSISGKKKQKEAQNMLNAMKIGDKVKTIGGVCGYLVEINEAENTIVIETGSENNKSYLKFDRGAIYQTAPVNAAAPAEGKTESKPAEATENKAEDTSSEKAVVKEDDKTEEKAKKTRKSKKHTDEI